MSRHIPVCNAHDVVRVLRRHSFFFVDQNGRQVIVAQHGSKPILIGTLKHTIKGSGLDIDDFR